MLAPCDDDFMPAGVVRLSFRYLSVVIITHRFPFTAPGRRPRMSIVTNSGGQLVDQNYSFPSSFGYVPFRVHVLQLLTVVYTSLNMSG